MAGFFGLFDFTKEGPGVSKNEPDKGPFLETVELMFRRFWELIKLNWMMILFQLPALAIAFFGTLIAFTALFPQLSVEALTAALAKGQAAQAQQMLESAAITQLSLIYLVIAVALVGLAVLVVGPFQAGFAYILRNYIRDEHVFTWSDFWEQAKANFKQSSLASLISLGVSTVLVVNFAFYHNTTTFLTENVRVVIQGLIVMLAVIWVGMQAYLYPMMVTFNLSLIQLYRNSLLFVFLRLPYNLLQLVLSLGLIFIVPGFLFFYETGVSVVLAMVWYLVFAFSFSQFFAMAFVWRSLDRFMIQRQGSGPSTDIN